MDSGAVPCIHAAFRVFHSLPLFRMQLRGFFYAELHTQLHTAITTGKQKTSRDYPRLVFCLQMNVAGCAGGAEK